MVAKLEKTTYTSTELVKIFRMTSSLPNTLIAAEKSGYIPKAARIKRGKVDVRQWTIDQVPAIGSRYGFLKKPKSTRVICVYTAKGGVLKSSFSYNLGRMLALNGQRVLLCGLDIQGSLTDMVLRPLAVESLDEYQKFKGIWDAVEDKKLISKYIIKTPLPTLDIIPETPDLGPLEKMIRNMTKREFFLKEKIVDPLRKNYDVIIFDNSPNWNLLIENALTASNVVISPVGCDLGTYQALETNLAMTFDFKREMKLEWDNFILLPTLLEKNKLSSQIYGAYLNHYPEFIIHTPIRRAVRGQESLTMRQSAIEYDVRSDLAQDYFESVETIWSRILESEK